MKVYHLLVAVFFISLQAAGQNTSVNLDAIITNGLSHYSADSVLHKILAFNNGATIQVPKTFSNTRTGTKDSEMGVISNGSLNIHYDLGYSAGLHMGNHKKNECSAYKETEVNGCRAAVGVIGNQLIVAIVNREQQRAFQFPANFWVNVNSEAEAAKALKIIFTYRAKDNIPQ